MSKIVIDFKDVEYKKVKQHEQNIFFIYEMLKELSSSAIGKNVDMVKMLSEDASKYLVDTYAELYLKDRPEHLDRREMLVRHTKINLLRVMELQNEMNKLTKVMGEHAPVVTDKGIKSNIKKKEFNVYLNESKRDHYQAVVNLLNAMGEVEVYTKLGSTANLMRSFRDLKMSSDSSVLNGVEINPQLFM